MTIVFYHQPVITILRHHFGTETCIYTVIPTLNPTLFQNSPSPSTSPTSFTPFPTNIPFSTSPTTPTEAPTNLAETSNTALVVTGTVLAVFFIVGGYIYFGTLYFRGKSPVTTITSDKLQTAVVVNPKI